MKTLINLKYHIKNIIRTFSFILLYTFLLSSCKQPYKDYTFQDIGMQIRIPTQFLHEDSFPKHTLVDADGNQLTDLEKRSELNDDLMKGLLIVRSRNRKNTGSFSIAKQTSKTGNFEQYDRFSKDMQQMMAKQQMTDYDTLSSILRIGNIDIHKFLTVSTNTSTASVPKQYSGIYIASVKNYFLVVKVDYSDEEFGAEIEKAILASTFN